MRSRPAELVILMVAAALAAGCAEKLAPAPEVGGPPARREDGLASWNAALAEAKASKSPLVAIVLPPRAEDREALRRAFETLVRTDDVEVEARLLEAVYVIAPAERVGALPGETLVRLDLEGRRVAGAASSLERAAFLAATRSLLRDADDWPARVAASRTPDVAKVLDEIRGADDATWPAAVERAAAQFPAAAAAIVDAREREQTPSARTRLDWTIESAFRSRRGDPSSLYARPLPFGAKWTRPPSPKGDPCLGCGMMRIPERREDVLELLAKDA